MMVAWLPSSAPDILPRRNPLSTRRNPKFSSQDAVFLLQKCENVKQMKQIHAKIIRNGLADDQLIVTNLLRLCSSYGEIDCATLVFNQTVNPSTLNWNLLIRAYAINGCSRRAILLYNVMICRGALPDKFTFPFVLKACLACSFVDKAKEVHGLAIKTGFSGDLYLENVLMDLYFKCGKPLEGVKVFDKMRGRSIVSWTTMLSGLVSNGELAAAEHLFDQMPQRNVVSWTAMIDGFARSESPEKAFEFFSRMLAEHVEPNEYTLVSLLVACAELGSLRLGCWVHDYAVKNGFDIGVFLGTALIDMYSKCGDLRHAKCVFDNMEVRSLATWNTMITSLGVHGCGEEALALFEYMERANVEPDAITLVGVLCACLHVNDLEKARRYFSYMTEQYGITPTIEHYTCMAELYYRANELERSEVI